MREIPHWPAVPCAQVLPVPGELREWARSTSQMALVGVCLGVISQWRREREAGEQGGKMLWQIGDIT